MACRWETRHFITASLRGPEGQAGLAGRSRTLCVWECGQSQGLPRARRDGVLGGEQRQRSGRGCQEDRTMTLGTLSHFSHWSALLPKP